MIVRIPLAALLALATPAVAQESYVLDADGNILQGVIATEAFVEEYDVPLEPGEEIIGFYAAPSSVWVPVEAEVIHEAPYVPPVEIDRVTGLPRNTAGWTGDADAPLGIGCFPQGVCADLND